jgi:hypothetical protein
MDNIKEAELKRLERELISEFSRHSVPEELPPNFVNKVRQKIIIRQRQIFVHHIFSVAGVAAMLLIGLGITWYLLKETRQEPQIKPAPPQAQADEFEARLAQVSVPHDISDRIMVLSKLIGSDTFLLSFDRKNDALAFISPQGPGNLNSDHWENKLQRAIDKFFPKAQIIICLLENNNCREFGVVE